MKDIKHLVVSAIKDGTGIYDIAKDLFKSNCHFGFSIALKIR